MKSMWVLLLALAVRATPPGAIEKKVAEAKVSFAEAVEKGSKEGTTVGVRLSLEKERLLYHVRVAKGEESTLISFDARSGEQVTKAVEKKSHATAVAAAKLGVAKAMEIALKKVPGKVYAAKLEMDKGKAVYEIRVLAGAKRRELDIDAVSGAVLDDDEDDDDDDDEDEDEDDDD